MRALKLLTSNSIKYLRELASDYEDLNEVVDFMEKISIIEEEQKLKNTDINLARQEGELASKKETIKNLTDMKMSSEQIAVAVNMPIEEVEMIKKEYMAIEM